MGQSFPSLISTARAPFLSRVTRLRCGVLSRRPGWILIRPAEAWRTCSWSRHADHRPWTQLCAAPRCTQRQ